MKSISIMTLLFAVLLAIGCDSSSDGNAENDPGLNKTSVNDSPNPYPVSEGERIESVNKLIEMRKEMLLLEGKLIAPATEDLDAYSDFLQEENTGMARLFPRNSDNERRPLLVRGSGAYYQFKGQTNEYGYGNDVEYSTTNGPVFSVGFAGVDYGFFGQLGKVDIRGIDSNNPAIAFAIDHQSPHNQPEPAWREQQRKWSVAGDVHNGVTFKDHTEAVVGMTYVVRSINENGYDIVAVFQVVRRDDTDDSLVLAWKIIQEFEKPVLERN